MFLVMGITGKVGVQRQNICWRTARKYARWSATARRRQAGRTGAWNWLTVIGMTRQPSSGRSKAWKARLSCCRPFGRPRPITKKQRA